MTELSRYIASIRTPPTTPPEGRKPSYKTWRKAQLKKHPHCAVYPFMGSAEIHHIARGVHKENALTEPCATVAVSIGGHRVIEGWPIEKQLACKLCASSEHAAEIDLKRFNEIRGRDENAITLADLAPYIKLAEGAGR